MENKLKIVLKSFFLFIVILSAFAVKIKAATLTQGDIAVIGMNEFTDKVTLVTLVSIPSGTVIKITDYGWDGVNNAFINSSTADGIITWTTASLIPAGTILELLLDGSTGNNTLTNLSTGANLNTSIAGVGWTSATNTIVPNGEQIFIYQDSESNPFFIFGLNNSAFGTFDANNWNNISITGTAVQSFLPNGTGSQNALTNGTNAIGLPSGTNQQDNVQYTGPTTTATKATWLSRIANLANWGGDNTSPGTTVNTISSPTNPTITVGTPNNAPTDIALSATSINENVATNSQIGTISSTDADAGNTFTYSFVAGGADNGSFTISGNILTINSIPNFESKSSYAITIRTTDQGNLFFDKAFTVTVNNVNETPTNITLSATAINENVAANSQIGTFSTTDVDVGNTFTYSFVAGGADNGSFTISGNSLTINSIPNFESKSSYTITIRTTDQGNLFFDKAFTITVNNVNETPTDLALSATSINENVAANSTVGTISTTDPDASNTFTYTLVTGAGDTDNASFNISGANLRITSSPNFETKSSYTVRIRTTDQSSLTFEEAFTITINNVNETPTDLALSATSINENVAANSTIGTLSSTDTDASNTFTYTLVTGAGDTDNASFNISGANLRITSSPNFEVKNSYTVRIRTTDQGSLTFEEAFTITINNVNETPTDIALSATSINENVAANSTVGTISTTDPDASNTFTYTLVTGAGDTDNASFNISGANLRITSSPNFEVKNSYTVRIRTTDQGSLTYEEAFTITINNVNETPTDIALSATAINENVAANSQIGTFSTTDVDAGNTFTYSFVAGGADNGSFTISGNSLTINSIPNFEAKSSYAITIRTTDQGNLFYDKAFTITVNNVNESPTDIALSANNVNENVAANTTVGTLSTTDPDASNTFTYTLVAGVGDTDNASFNISGANLRIASSPNFETKNSYTVRVRTTDQGSLNYEEAFTITINNVNEAPIVANSIPNQNSTENQTLNFQFGANTFSDVDAGTTLTYTSQLNGGGALPSWLTFTAATRTFSGTPLISNIGTITIDVIANDGSGGTVTAIFNIVVGATLPVTLNEYNAKLQTDGSVLLTWDTFSEQNNDYFELSKSTDGQNFVVLSNIKGKGTTAQRSLYNHIDRTPKSGDNYYKLVQVDLDGTRKELGISTARVTLTNASKVTIYPNPTADLVNVSFKPGEFINAYLFDLSGKVLIRKAITQQNESLNFDLSDLPSSLYLIRLEGDNRVFSKQIIKNN